jgi:putative sigma-54 modulation protein
MNVTTTARHCELDPEVRLFAEERVARLGRFARDLAEAHVVVTAEKYRHSAEITVRVRGQEFVSREESNEARTAIDLAADRLEHQIRRLKEKRIERKRGSRARVAGTLPPPPRDGDGSDSEPFED